MNPKLRTFKLPPIRLSPTLARQIKWLEYLWRLSLTSSLAELTLGPGVTPFSPLFAQLARISQQSYPNQMFTTRASYWHKLFEPRRKDRYYSGETLKGRKLGSSPQSFAWFQDYWTLHQVRSNVERRTHPHFKLMFSVALDPAGVYGAHGLSKFYLRWSTASSLLMNLFFFRASTLSFANKIFVEETLALNWHLSFSSYRLFKYTQRLFYFRDVRYGNETRMGFYKLETEGFDVAIVADVKFHEKNLFFLKRFNFYTIGLSPANYDPWELCFPIPLLGDSILGQYYFLSMVAQMSGSARLARFSRLNTEWSQLISFIKAPYVPRLGHPGGGL